MEERVFPNVTGRDFYVVGEALALAVSLIDSLPEDLRDAGRRRDMIEIFNSLFKSPALRNAVVDEVEALTGRPSALTLAAN